MNNYSVHNTHLTSFFSIELEESLETLTQRYAAQIIASRSTSVDDKVTFETVDIVSLELVRPRRIGIEQLALHAVKQLTLDDKLKSLGFNQHQLAASIGNIIARMAAPASELATYHWLQNQSGLGELIDYDFEGMGLDRLYQVSDLNTATSHAMLKNIKQLHIPRVVLSSMDKASVCA